MELHEEVGAVRRETVLDAPREEAWDRVCDLEGWLGAEASQAEVQERHEQRRLVFTWSADGVPSLVEVTLDDHSRGTRVVVVEIPLVTLDAFGPAVAASSMRGPLACV
jgi:uncharacterized protein YndB with AHSA1/START domain